MYYIKAALFSHTHTHTHTRAQPFRAVCLTSPSDFLHLGGAVVPQGSRGIWIWQGIPFPWKSGLPSHSQGTACWGSNPFASGVPGGRVHPRWTKEGSLILPNIMYTGWENVLLLGTRRGNSLGNLHEPTALQTWTSISKLSDWSLTFGPWDAMLSSHPFRSDPISSVQRNVKELQQTPHHLPSSTPNEKWGGSTNGEICEWMASSALANRNRQFVRA